MNSSELIFKENWSKWEPQILGLGGNYDIIEIQYNPSFFKILLEHETSLQKVEVIFHDSVLASRHVNESLRFILFAELSKKYGDIFYAQWAFFKVTDSDLLNWLSVYSGGVSDNYKLINFVIKGLDTVLDIVASCEPEIRMIQD